MFLFFIFYNPVKMNVAQSLAGNIIDYLSFAFSSKKKKKKYTNMDQHQSYEVERSVTVSGGL